MYSGEKPLHGVGVSRLMVLPGCFALVKATISSHLLSGSLYFCLTHISSSTFSGPSELRISGHVTSVLKASILNIRSSKVYIYFQI